MRGCRFCDQNLRGLYNLQQHLLNVHGVKKQEQDEGYFQMYTNKNKVFDYII